MKRIIQFFPLLCCLLLMSVCYIGCATGTGSNYDLTSYVRVSDTNSDDKRIVYLKPKTCTNDDFAAEIYGSVTDGGAVLNIERKDYTFKQIAGRVWSVKVSVTEAYEGDVIIYARRQILGKTLGIEYETDIYGNELICAIGEGYGEVDWIQCFSYTYFAY